MEHKLMWGTLGLGVLGWVTLALLFFSRRAAPETPDNSSEPPGFFPVRRSFIFLSFLLPVFIWFSTLPVKAPFSSGQGFGRGFLLGGWMAFFSVALVMTALSRRPANPRAAATISLFGGLIVASVPLLWMRSAVIEALLGAALGWLAVSLIWLLGLDSRDREIQSGASNSLHELPATLILNGAAFVTALLGVAALGVYRDFVFATVARGTHSAVILALGASVSLVFLADALLGAMILGDSTSGRNPARRSSLFAAGLALIVPLGVGFLLATKVLTDPTLVWVVVAGLVLGGLLWILVRADAVQNDAVKNDAVKNDAVQNDAVKNDAVQNQGQLTSRVPFAATLVALCGFMVSYGLMQGFGVGVMLLCAWPATLLALPASVSVPVDGDSTKNEGASSAKFAVAQTLSLLAAFSTLLLFSRLFATRFRPELRGANFDDQFALFGFVAGAMLPFLLGSLWFETGRAQGSSRSRSLPHSLPRLFFVGIAALAIAGAMLALWGAKVVPAFLVGLSLSVVVGFIFAFTPRIGASATALFALCLAVFVTQWTQRFLPLAELTRAQRLHFLWWSMGAAVLLLLLLDYGSRWLDWAKNRGTPNNPPASTSSNPTTSDSTISDSPDRLTQPGSL